jgi:hypothetical protein
MPNKATKAGCVLHNYYSRPYESLLNVTAKAMLLDGNLEEPAMANLDLKAHAAPIVWALIASGLLITASQPAAAQSGQSEHRSDDIVVEGYRTSPEVETRARSLPSATVTNSRAAYAFSKRIAECATRARLTDLTLLRAVVDGEFNSPEQRLAQDRLKRTYITCSESTSLLSFSSVPRPGMQGFKPGPGDGFAEGSASLDQTPLGWSVYDRGAFTLAALKHFVPDLRLTKAQTADPAVQARFNIREGPRNRLRFPADSSYFEIAVCMTRVEPELATRLSLSDTAARFGDLQAALIDRARVCVGNAKAVELDPTQFRFYIGDAVYRWAVAARDVSSLIPSA